MPRKVKFNSARQACARKTAKKKDRGGGGKFTKVHATACDEDVSASHIQNTGLGKGNSLAYHSQHYNAMGSEQDNWEGDDSCCYFCHSTDNCEVDTEIHYTLCSSCRTLDQTLGWWDNTDDVGMGTNDLHLPFPLSLSLSFSLSLSR